MEEFLREAFQTDDIDNIDHDKVKKFVQPSNKLLPRLTYRRGVGRHLQGRKSVVVLKSKKKEELEAEERVRKLRNPRVGFR